MKPTVFVLVKGDHLLRIFKTQKLAINYVKRYLKGYTLDERFINPTFHANDDMGDLLSLEIQEHYVIEKNS